MNTILSAGEDNAYNQAQYFFSKQQLNLLDVINEYACTGHHCYISKTHVIIAKYYGEYDCWHVYFATGRGSLSRFFDISPFSAKYVSFARPEKGRAQSKTFEWERLKKLCKLRGNT